MKKIFAMLLALCLLLSVVPVLAEDFSGLWHMVVAEVDLGFLQLNEDGTVNADLVGVGEVGGTWSAEGDTVTISLEGEALIFTWDGTMLYNPELMFPVIREEGRVPSDIISAYFGGEEYELPEGMTKEEVETVGKNFYAEYQRLMVEKAAAEAEASAAAGNTVDIISENHYVIESYSGYRAVWLAKVMNMNQNPVYIRSGSLQVKDTEGNLVGSATYLSNRGSYYLEPGETTFVSMEAEIPENVEVTCERALEVSPDPYRKDFALTAADSDFTFGEGDYATSWMQTTVTNPSENPATPQVIFCLADAEGTPWLVEETSLYRHELTPGSSLIMKQNLDDRFVKMLNEKGVKITTIEAYAWCEIDD